MTIHCPPSYSIKVEVHIHALLPWNKTCLSSLNSSGQTITEIILGTGTIGQNRFDFCND